MKRGLKRLLVGKFAAPGVFRDGRKGTETLGSWPLGRTEPAGASERRARVKGTRRSWDAWCPQPWTNVSHSRAHSGLWRGRGWPERAFYSCDGSGLSHYSLPRRTAEWEPKPPLPSATPVCAGAQLPLLPLETKAHSAGPRPLCRQRLFGPLDPLRLPLCCVTH